MNSLRLIYRKVNTNYKINKGKSSLTSLVACLLIKFRKKKMSRDIVDFRYLKISSKISVDLRTLILIFNIL